MLLRRWDCEKVIYIKKKLKDIFRISTWVFYNAVMHLSESQGSLAKM